MLRALAAALTLAASPLAAAEVTSFTLENGMEVVVLEDHRAPVVVHMVWYRVGSADEPRGKSGIAHFLEHLMFKGTDTMETGELSRVVAENGGSDNAFTSQDYTAYFQRVAADRLSLMMEMEADRMTGLKLTEEVVLPERDVVLEERNQRTENDPGALFGEERSAAQYLNHPYGVPVIGWRHEVASLTQDDAVAFYRQHYAPNNAILIVAGDVEPESVRSLAETHYGTVPPNPALGPRERAGEPPQRAERRLLYEDPRVQQPVVIRTYLAPERDPGDQREAAALTLLSELLGGSPATSFLGRALQFETQTAVYAGAFYNGTSLDDTTFGLVVVPAAGVSLDEAEAAMDAAVVRFLAEGIDPAQLDRIKMQVRAADIYADDDISGMGRRYGAALASGLTVADVEAWSALLQEIEPDEVIAAATRVLDRRQAVTGFMRAPLATEAAAPAPAPSPAATPAAAEAAAADEAAAAAAAAAEAAADEAAANGAAAADPAAAGDAAPAPAADGPAADEAAGGEAAADAAREAAADADATGEAAGAGNAAEGEAAADAAAPADAVADGLVADGPAADEAAADEAAGGEAAADATAQGPVADVAAPDGAAPDVAGEAAADAAPLPPAGAPPAALPLPAEVQQ